MLSSMRGVGTLVQLRSDMGVKDTEGAAREAWDEREVVIQKDEEGFL